MFTGIIENMAEVVDVKTNKNNLDILFKSPLLPELKVDQSISHNGVCLTVAGIPDVAQRYKGVSKEELAENGSSFLHINLNLKQNLLNYKI